MKKPLAILAVLLLMGGSVLAFQTGTRTTNLNMFKPDVSSVNWGAEINLNFDTLDSVLSGTADAFGLRPNATGNDLGTTTRRWDVFAETVTFNTDVSLTRSAANTLQLATGDLFVPQTTDQDIGTTSLRWDLFGNNINYDNQLTSLIVTGTSPFVVASTTKVVNLNVEQVDGGDWAAPLAIGTGTPADGDFTRLKAKGTALVAGDIAIVTTGAWGDTANAVVSAVTGNDQWFQWTITAGGANTGANPTIIITFTDGTWTTAPIVMCNRQDFAAPATVTITVTTVTATVLTLTFDGTPTVTNVYRFACHVGGI